MSCIGECILLTNVKNGAEAATPQFGKFINSEHLDIITWTSLVSKPFLKFDHLDVFEADSGIDGTIDDAFGYVHSAANGGVLIRSHTIVFGKLVNLDLVFY